MEIKNDFVRELELAKQGFWAVKDYPEWEKSVRAVKEMAKVFDLVPDKFIAWSDQIYRAAVSVPCNVSEAIGRGTLNMTAQYYRVAKGSAYEVLTLLYCCPVELPQEWRKNWHEICADIDSTMVVLATERLSRQ